MRVLALSRASSPNRPRRPVDPVSEPEAPRERAAPSAPSPWGMVGVDAPAAWPRATSALSLIHI
eukprot:7236360-Alexandrium_andersonii.AAC.1